MFLVLLIPLIAVAHQFFVLPAVDGRGGCLLGVVILGLLFCHRSYFRKVVPSVLSLLQFLVRCLLVLYVSVGFYCWGF